MFGMFLNFQYCKQHCLDIIVYVSWCVCVRFSGDTCECGVAGWSLSPALPDSVTLLYTGASLHSPQSICDLVELHLPQHLVSSNFGSFAHLCSVKWYLTVSSFNAAVPWLRWGRLSYYMSVGLSGCCFWVPVHKVPPLLYWWWDSGAKKWIDCNLWFMTYDHHLVLYDPLVYSYF